MAIGNPVIDLFDVIVKIDGSTIGGISDDGLPFPSGAAKIRDVTTQDSGTSTEKRLGRYESGNTTIKGNYIPADAGQIALAAAAADRAVHSFTIDLSAQGGGIISFDGLVTSFAPGNSGNTETFTAKLEITGSHSIATDYCVLSGLTIATTTAMIPAFGASVTKYTCTVATGTSTVTVTPTVATGSMYVNGTLCTTTATVTLGGAGSSTDFTIRVTGQTNKAAQIITVRVGRP